MKALLGFITALSIPLMVLNLLGGIVSGITSAFEVQAICLANFLQLAKRTKSKERASKIESFIARSLDSESADSRLREFTDATVDLRLDSLGLLVMIFLITPILVWKWKLVAIWPFLLTYLVLNVALIAWNFHRSNRALFPLSGNSRWGTLATIVLSPPVALRVAKYLARDIGNDFHPLAFAASRSSNNEFRDLASWVLRDLKFAPEVNAGLDKRAADCATWFRQTFHEAVSALVHRHGDDPDELTAPHSRESEHIISATQMIRRQHSPVWNCVAR